MNERRPRGWAALGALASAALLTAACEQREWPRAGSDFEGRANESQDLESFVGEEEPDVVPPAMGGSGVEPEPKGEPAPRQEPAEGQR